MLLKLFSWDVNLNTRNTLYLTEEEYSNEEESDSDADDINEETFVHQLDRQDLIWIANVSLSNVNCARITLGHYLVLSDHLSI
ncbi:hypothetical protein L208DRAFT_1410447 [Tricholoma matsutake]|nr:hypothetical protein L208DRAFT_1410447 [Tricholoma matsutake 945]